jgi:hypothetical protein
VIESPFNQLERGRRLRRYLSLILAAAIALPASNGQTPAQPPAAQPQGTTRTLKVVALAGNGEFNDLANKVMAPLVIEVLDQNDDPVEGADVTFRFPLQGPGATFADQKTSAISRTGPDGQAAATGWMANSQVGKFQVQVTATRANEYGFGVLMMTNVTKMPSRARSKSKSWWTSKWAIVTYVAVAAAVVVGVVLATRGSGSKVIVVNPGSPTIGAPQQ